MSARHTLFAVGFATLVWADPCVAEIGTLADFQAKYERQSVLDSGVVSNLLFRRVFILGNEQRNILVNTVYLLNDSIGLLQKRIEGVDAAIETVEDVEALLLKNGVVLDATYIVGERMYSAVLFPSPTYREFRFPKQDYRWLYVSGELEKKLRAFLDQQVILSVHGIFVGMPVHFLRCQVEGDSLRVSVSDRSWFQGRFDAETGMLFEGQEVWNSKVSSMMVARPGGVNDENMPAFMRLSGEEMAEIAAATGHARRPQGGLGAVVRFSQEKGYPEVTSVTVGRGEDGLQEGDLILAVDGHSVEGVYSFSEAIRMLRGPVGTFVTLLVERQGTQRELTLERVPIDTGIGTAR